MTVSALDVMAASAARNECRRLDSVRWTNPQRDFLSCRDPVALFWGANKVGKSWAVVGDALMFLRGEHPWDQTHKPPVCQLFLGQSWKQMAGTLKIFWHLADRGQFPGIRYDGGTLKGQKYAVFEVKSGPGRGGEIIFGTFEEGAERWAGFAAHRVNCDEPMGEELYGELWPRLVRFGGHMRLGFTPTLGTASRLDYLWALVESGAAREFQVPLTLDAVTPRGGLFEFPWMTQRDIDAFEVGLLPAEKDMRMGRSRHPLSGDRVLTGFGEHLVRPDPPPVGALLGIGIDHGSGAGRQRAVIVAAQARGLEQRIWVLNEVYSDGRTTPRQDAQGIIAALAAIGQSIESVDVWIGDRKHPGDAFGGWKDNKLLLRGFAEELGVQIPRLPLPLRKIHTPYKPSGSVRHGARVLNALCLQERLLIHPRCTQLPVDLSEWAGLETDHHKDGFDALHYVALKMIDPRRALLPALEKRA